MNCSILAHSLQALCLVMEYMGTELWTKILDNMAIKKVETISVYLSVRLFVDLFVSLICVLYLSFPGFFISGDSMSMICTRHERCQSVAQLSFEYFEHQKD